MADFLLLLNLFIVILMEVEVDIYFRSLSLEAGFC